MLGLLKKKLKAAAHANSEFEKQKNRRNVNRCFWGICFSSIDGGVKAMAQSVIESIEKIAEKLAAEGSSFAIMSVIISG